MEIKEPEDKKGVTVVAKMPDKSKRDEWSEGGVLTLLDSYQEKWVLRNRAKLKGSDWDDIAREVSSRDNGKKSIKSPNQCKNKIEAMKKRYRAESATSTSATWQFFPRMEQLLKGKDVVANGAEETIILHTLPNLGDRILENEANHNNGKVAQDPIQGNNQDDGSNTGPENSEFSTPYNPEENFSERFLKRKSVKRRRREGGDVAGSIRMLARSFLKIEQGRVEMFRDSERIRAEAEIKRAEMDLKRTEIVAETQLQIAKLLVRAVSNHAETSGSSSLAARQTAKEKS